MRGKLALALGVAFATAATTWAAPAGGRRHAIVARVIDGDTIVLTGGEHVRLVQIDSPELGTGECYSRAAATLLGRMLPHGSAVALEADPHLDQVDAYGRLLRYVWSRGLNLNVQLVRAGAATVWFYHGDRGRYAGRLLAAARAARTAGRGLWGACPAAVWDPYGPATTGQTGARARPKKVSCDPSYPTVCIPPPPPDLDCRDIGYRNFRVLPPDPHHFDRDHDGRGCEG